MRTLAIAIALGAVSLAGCGGSPAKSLSAADDAIRASDDFIRAADEFTPPWSVVPDAPPPTTVYDEAVTPAVSRSPSIFSSTLDELREADVVELAETSICALLKYQLEYSEVPDASSIEEYLVEVSDVQELVWVTQEDKQTLAVLLEDLGNEIAALGLSSEAFGQLALDVCEALP